jgi:alcohol dehydrogenase class IV
MSFVTWSFPTTVVFGNGSLSVLGDPVRRVKGTRALVVCDPGVVKAGIAEKVKRVLDGAGVASAVFDKVEPNPVLRNVTDGLAAYRAHGADVVVSVGGGSPLDVGKLIALGTSHDRPLEEYDDAIGGDAHITSNVPPILTVPTTAGTAS